MTTTPDQEININIRPASPVSDDSKHESEETVVPVEETETGPETSAETTAETNEETKYQDGQILKFVRVRFPGNAKSFPFLIGKRRFEYGKKVVAMSDRGMAVGYINSFPYEAPFNKSMLPLQSIVKMATDFDVEKDYQNISREKEAKALCKDLIYKHQLDMELTHVEYTQFGKKAVFYFTSPARVDFRGLVKDLVNDLKMRIELRQIGLRDRTAALGGIGPCGLQLCCNSFLGKYGNVNLKMAKNQNLAMNPGRLNGVCGQLKCCVQYEDEVYKEKISRLPPIGEFILVANGDKGRVDRHHILIEQFDMLTDQGQRRRYSINQYDTKLKLPSDWQFPTEFEHIANETDVVVGLKQEETDKTTQFIKNMLPVSASQLGLQDEEDDLEVEEEKIEDKFEIDEDVQIKTNNQPQQQQPQQPQQRPRQHQRRFHRKFNKNKKPQGSRE